jgi:hypothetical protein
MNSSDLLGSRGLTSIAHGFFGRFGKTGTCVATAQSHDKHNFSMSLAQEYSIKTIKIEITAIPVE